jgi:hypothetical protein
MLFFWVFGCGKKWLSERHRKLEGKCRRWGRGCNNPLAIKTTFVRKRRLYEWMWDEVETICREEEKPKEEVCRLRLN